MLNFFFKLKQEKELWNSTNVVKKCKKMRVK